MKPLQKKEINIIEQLKVKPIGKIFTYTQDDIDELIIDFVELKTGFVLNLKVDCFGEPSDVLIEWLFDGSDDDNKLFDDYRKFETDMQSFDSSYVPLNISVNESFENRKNILSRLFQSELIDLEYVNDDGLPYYNIYVY